MAIVAGDIDFYLSGGAANTDPNAALGGARSTSTQITDASLHNLFDLVSAAESNVGDTEYRCFYVRNAHGSLTLTAAQIWVETNTPAADTTIEISLGTSSVNGTEQTIANENTAPSGTSFSAANGSGAALTIGDLATTEHKAIWVKRIISAGAAAVNADSAIIRVRGTTAA